MNLEQRIAQGMQLVPRLPDLTTAQVDDDLRRLYLDIQQTLRVPFVNFVFRMLANYPSYLRPAWQTLAPRVRTREFEQAADRLRAATAQGLDAEALAADDLEPLEREAVAAFTDSIHYVLPKLLLVATAFDAQWGDETGPKASAGAALHPVDAGVAAGARLLPLVDPADADARVQAIFADIRRTHEHPGVASYYRGLANHPAFLDRVWGRVRPHIDTPAYRQRKQALLALAQERVADLALGGATDAEAVTADQRQDIRAILAVFRFRIIPDLLLDVVHIKAMLDGTDAAARSRFSMS